MARALAKKRILIVEDDVVINSMYQTKLELDGFEVLSATNGSMGLDLARKEKNIDMILLDVIMPQLDGFSVLTELKGDAETKDIPVMMLTNLGTEEDKAKGEKMGVVDYVVKSSQTPAQVSEKVKKILKVK